MTTVSFGEAKAHLSKYARMAEQGKSVLVEKHHKPSFVIAPVEAGFTPRLKRFGMMRGKIRMADDFVQTPEAVIAAFYGEELV